MADDKLEPFGIGGHVRGEDIWCDHTRGGVYRYGDKAYICMQERSRIIPLPSSAYQSASKNNPNGAPDEYNMPIAAAAAVEIRIVVTSHESSLFIIRV